VASRFGAAIVGGFFGLLLGVGIGLYLSQTGALNMSRRSSLVLPMVGVLIGLAAGFFGGRRRRSRY
jgi:uncharacterized membrane protein